MKAMSVRQPFLDAILFRVKTIEVRRRSTRYRGPLALHASARPCPPYRRDPARPWCTLPLEDEDEDDVMLLGLVLAVADLTDCRPMSEADREAACLEPDVPLEGLWAWQLDNVRLIEPLAAAGAPGFWEVSDALITYLEDEEE